MDRIFNIRRDEGCTLVIEIGRTPSFERYIGNIFHFYTEGFQGRFFQKRSGSCGAGFVHGIVRGNRIGDIGVLCILAPDFKNGIDLGVKIDGSRGMGDDFVDNAIG